MAFWRCGRPTALRSVPALWWALWPSHGVTKRSGVVVGVPGRGTGTGEQGQGNSGQGDRGRGEQAIFHALCVNCKENLAKTRIKTEISRKTRKFLPKNLHKAKICRTFASSKRKTNKSNETF